MIPHLFVLLLCLQGEPYSQETCRVTYTKEFVSKETCLEGLQSMRAYLPLAILAEPSLRAPEGTEWVIACSPQEIERRDANQSN